MSSVIDRLWFITRGGLPVTSTLVQSVQVIMFSEQVELVYHCPIELPYCDTTCIRVWVHFTDDYSTDDDKSVMSLH